MKKVNEKNTSNTNMAVELNPVLLDSALYFAAAKFQVSLPRDFHEFDAGKYHEWNFLRCYFQDLNISKTNDFLVDRLVRAGRAIQIYREWKMFKFDQEIVVVTKEQA